MQKDFSSLMASNAIAQGRARQPGEASAIVRGRITSGADSAGLQRHTATTAGKAGLVECPPGSRLLPAPYWDPPQFTKGQTCLVGAIEGDGHNLSVLGVELNQVNVAPKKGDAEKDDSRFIPGAKILLIAGDETRQVNGGIVIVAGATRVEISPNGQVSIEAATVLVSGNLEVGGDLTVAGGATVAGKDVVVVSGGALDSGGDFMVASGQ